MHASDDVECISQETELATQRGLGGQARDDARFARRMFTELSNRADETHRLAKNGRGRREGMEKATLGVRTCDQCDGARIHEEVAGDSSSEDGGTRQQRDPDFGGNGD